MPMVDTGLGDLATQAMQLAEIMRRAKMQQGQNLLGLALPGQTVEQVLDPRTARATLGRNYNPQQIVKEKTIDTEMNRAGVEFLDAVRSNPQLLDQATPGDIITIGASAVGNKLGTPGISTPGALRSKARTSETQAKTAETASKSVLDLVQEGTAAFKNASAKTRAAIGQKLAVGQTAENAEMERLQNELAIETTKYGIQFAADPNKHPLAKQLRGLGIDPTAALAAAGTGMLSLLGSYAQMAVDAEQGRIQMRVASANRSNALLEAQLKVDNEWADRMSQAIGGKLPPSAILSVMRTPRESIKDPKLLADYDKAAGLIDNASEMAFKVVVADAYRKGNPRVAGMEQLTTVLKGVKDTKAAEALGTEIRRQVGEITATQMVGARPEDPKLAATWDALAQKYSDLAPKEPGRWDRFVEWLSNKPRDLNPGQTMGIPNSAMPQQPLGVPQAPAAQPGTPMGGQNPIGSLTPEDQAALATFLQAAGLMPAQPQTGGGGSSF